MLVVLRMPGSCEGMLDAAKPKPFHICSADCTERHVCVSVPRRQHLGPLQWLDAVGRLTPGTLPAATVTNGPTATANGPAAADGSAPAAVRALPSLLANMLIARIDFLLRFVVGLLYGARPIAFAGWDMPA